MDADPGHEDGVVSPLARLTARQVAASPAASSAVVQSASRAAWLRADAPRLGRAEARPRDREADRRCVHRRAFRAAHGRRDAQAAGADPRGCEGEAPGRPADGRRALRPAHGRQGADRRGSDAARDPVRGRPGGARSPGRHVQGRFQAHRGEPARGRSDAIGAYRRIPRCTWSRRKPRSKGTSTSTSSMRRRSSRIASRS